MIVKDALECPCLSKLRQSILLNRFHLCIRTHVHAHLVAHSLILKACCAFSMQNFQAVTSATPGNVLRYCCDPGAQPLWGRASPTRHPETWTRAFMPLKTSPIYITESLTPLHRNTRTRACCCAFTDSQSVLCVLHAEFSSGHERDARERATLLLRPWCTASLG